MPEPQPQLSAARKKYAFLCPICGEYEADSYIASACPKCGKQGKRIWAANVHFHPTKGDK